MILIRQSGLAPSKNGLMLFGAKTQSLVMRLNSFSANQLPLPHVDDKNSNGAAGVLGGSSDAHRTLAASACSLVPFLARVPHNLAFAPSLGCRYWRDCALEQEQ